MSLTQAQPQNNFAVDQDETTVQIIDDLSFITHGSKRLSIVLTVDTLSRKINRVDYIVNGHRQDKEKQPVRPMRNLAPRKSENRVESKERLTADEMCKVVTACIDNYNKEARARFSMS